MEHSSIVMRAKGIGGLKYKLHDFTEIVRGFSAILTDAEVNEISGYPEVRCIVNDSRVKTLTTRTPTFLGLTNIKNGLFKRTTGVDMIIGVIDTGIWPERRSFSDSGYGKIPKKFKGICDHGEDPTFNCNRKVIGARYFGSGYAAYAGTSLKDIASSCPDYASPRDSYGHGTHVASIAGGVLSGNAILNNMNFGVAGGVAHSARLSIYKALWCRGDGVQSDVAAAIDAAVADGVDVVSLSIGFSAEFSGNSTSSIISYFAYKATMAGIPVVFAAGNNGPDYFTVENAEPWVMTVAAGTMDRVFSTSVTLGNGQKIDVDNFGSATGNLTLKTVPIVLASSVAEAGLQEPDASSCLPGTLNASKAVNKIVICSKTNGTQSIDDVLPSIKEIGAAGAFFLPTLDPSKILTSYPVYAKLLDYVNTHSHPLLSSSDQVFQQGSKYVEAPAVALFSAPGPNGGNFRLLKPDILAPGSEIVGAWSGSENWAIISGTSMACPHVSGVIALLKSVYPSWTPSMLFSAVMTTASQLTNRNKPIQWENGGLATPFNMGAGHVNPNVAVDPGLVYAAESKYATYLCSPESLIGSKMSLFNSAEICKKYPSTQAVDSNTPSISFYQVKRSAPVTTTRTVTNVASRSTYTVAVSQPRGARIDVRPSKLSFGVGQQLNFSVTLTPLQATGQTPGAVATTFGYESSADVVQYWTFGAITWMDNAGHSVRINVAVNIV